MKIVACIPCRNESWCVEFAIRSALEWCDEVVVLNHASTDDTSDILIGLLREYHGQMTIHDEHCLDWDEANYRQRMLQTARLRGATDIAMLDCDEALTQNLVPLIRDMLKELSPCEGFRPSWFQCWRSTTEYRNDNSSFGRATALAVFRDDPSLAHRPRGVEQIHTRVPDGVWLHSWTDAINGGLLHYQHASWRRVRAKQALYAMTELLRWNKPVEAINARYGPTTDEAGLTLATIPLAWAPKYSHLLKPDTTPWQEGECQRLWAKHGAKKFDGLDLYGVLP